MPDPFSAAVVGIKGAVSLGKGLIAVGKRLNDSELDKKTTELLQLLVTAELEAMKLQLENEQLKMQLAAKDEMRPEGTVFYAFRSDGTKTGPYCPGCWAKQRIQVLLMPANFDFQGLGYTWDCPACHTMIS